MTNLRDLLQAFAMAMNLISPEVTCHHEKAALLAWHLARQMELTEHERELAFYGGLLHDIGGVITGTTLTLEDIESNARALAHEGAALLRMYPHTRPYADVVLNSQMPWAAMPKESAMTRLSQIVHLADIITLIMSESEPVLNQLKGASDLLRALCGTEFSPEVVAAFDALLSNETVWLDAVYHPEVFAEAVPDQRGVGIAELREMTAFMAKLIDFRSPFTAMHSAGVAASAVCLARKAGMSEDECALMEIAGNLHDIGKLKIPKAILEKPGKLTADEFNVMKEHVYYSYRILNRVRGLETITTWAAFHHEKLDGSGYPFHLPSGRLPLGSRIMAVSDVFAATAENRPYRKPMQKEKVIGILREEALRGRLSREVVELLVQSYDETDRHRELASAAASETYRKSLDASGC